MLTNPQTPNHPTFGTKPVVPPVLAVDAASNQVYDVASLIKELKNPEYEKEGLAEKLDLFIQLSMTWVDDSASVSTIREMVQVMFRLRDAVAGIKVTCQQQ